MLKAVFFDIDGTLVSFKTHKVPASTVRAINELKEKGIKVFIATGRPFVAIDNLGDLKFDAYITQNGACCLSPSEGLIYENEIDKGDIDHLIDYVENKHSVPCVFMREHDCFINFLNETTNQVFEELNIPLERMGNVLPIDEARTTSVYQMTVFVDAEEEKLIAALMPNCSSARWSPHFTDMVSRGVSKQTGIDELLKLYNISIEETMAFGDGGNDIEMLKHVNLGVAMGNAKEEVKQYADYVTDSVDEDGIWNALKHFNIL